MTTDLLDAYVATWPKHTKADDSPEGRAALEALLALLSDDVTYTDVPSGHSFSGHEGVAQMCAIVSSNYDVALRILNAQTDGSRFAIEFESRAVVGESGATVESKGVAVGTITGGKISSHRDYHVSPQAPGTA